MEARPQGRAFLSTIRVSRTRCGVTLIDAEIHRQWLVALGLKDAVTRLGQLICELYLRLEAVNLAGDYTFDCPLTQSDLADMLGISNVHVLSLIHI